MSHSRNISLTHEAIYRLSSRAWYYSRRTNIQSSRSSFCNKRIGHSTTPIIQFLVRYMALFRAIRCSCYLTNLLLSQRLEIASPTFLISTYFPEFTDSPIATIYINISLIKDLSSSQTYTVTDISILKLIWKALQLIYRWTHSKSKERIAPKRWLAIRKVMGRLTPNI